MKMKLDLFHCELTTELCFRTPEILANQIKNLLAFPVLKGRQSVYSVFSLGLMFKQLCLEF